MKRARGVLLAILIAAGAQAQDSASPGPANAAPGVAPVIPALRVVGDAPPAPAPPKKHHRKHCRYGAGKVGGKPRCRAAPPPG